MANKKAGATKGSISKKKRKSVTYGKTDMVDAIYKELQNPQAYEGGELPASCKDVTKRAISAILDLEKETIIQANANGNKIQYVGFGNFEPRFRAERKGRNPQTGEEIDIESTTRPAFTPGKVYKDAVKAGHKE